jgi:hypothetical protein
LSVPDEGHHHRQDRPWLNLGRRFRLARSESSPLHRRSVALHSPLSHRPVRWAVAARPQVSIFNQTLFNFSVLRSRHQHLYQHQHLPHPQHIFPPTRVHHSAILTNSQFATSVFFNHTPPLCQPIFLRALPLLRRDRMPTDRVAAAEEVTGTWQLCCAP